MAECLSSAKVQADRRRRCPGNEPVSFLKARTFTDYRRYAMPYAVAGLVMKLLAALRLGIACYSSLRLLIKGLSAGSLLTRMCPNPKPIRP